MKKILFNILICSGLLALASCEKKVTTEDPSTITYYVQFEMNGDKTMYVPLNSTFTDPGVVATENGVDVNDKVKVSIVDASGAAVDAISTDGPGMYTMTYSAINSDGFSASSSRTVFVYDPTVTMSMAGTYNADMTLSLYGTKGKTFADYAPSYGFTNECTGITFTELCPGFYYCNDILGGWYDQIRGFGVSYNAMMGKMTGYVSLNADSTLTLLSSHINAWDDGLDYMDNSSFDPATGVVTYHVLYGGSVHVTPYLVKQ